MKINKLITGTIVAAFVLCLMAVVAVSLQSQPPAAANTTDNVSVATPVPTLREATQLSPQEAKLPEIFGMVWDTRGNCLSGINVTLHLMSNVYTDGRLSDIREVSNLTSTSDANGEYRFSSVPLTPGVDFYWVSGKKYLPDGLVTHGQTRDITLKTDSSVRDNIVLYIPSS